MTENVSLPPQQPSPRGRWMYGLKLVTCPSCIDERKIPYRCQTCDDYGEYWQTRTGAMIQMGKLERIINQLKQLHGESQGA